MTLSPNGKYVLTGLGSGRTLVLWDAVSGPQVRSFIGHADIVEAVAFSAYGHAERVLSGRRDQTARLWDAKTGQQLRLIAGHTDAVTGVAFSPDGEFVLTVSADGTARLWDADDHDAIRFVCSRLVRDLTDDERAQYAITDNEPTCPKP